MPTRMKQCLSKAMAVTLSLSVTLNLFMPSMALAAEARVFDANPDTSCSSIIGTYTFHSVERTPEATDPCVERTSAFAYNDEWFMGPSSTFNQHLATISAHVSIASSATWPNDLHRDTSLEDKNIVALLKDLGFDDVTSNGYYHLGNLPDSAGCTLGHKTIVQDGRPYTLLAITLRGNNYLQEWAGNFEVGDGTLHEGFLTARDEILRFTARYVQDNKITGDVKVWTCGHSRGGALTNLVGAFFEAGGASSYLKGISVKPDDVYAYAFATPNTVKKDGTTKGALLSVSAAGAHHSDPRYAEGDTPGTGIVYNAADAQDTLDPRDALFSGIHNVAPDYDFITLLPPDAWDYTRFGPSYDPQEGASRDKMLSILSDYDPFVYQANITAGDSAPSYKTFDLDTLNLVDDPSAGELTQEAFFRARANALAASFGDSQTYANSDAQEILGAIAAIVGMDTRDFANLDLLMSDPATTIGAVLLNYFAYAADRYRDEGLTDENAAVARAAGDLVGTFTGDEIDENMTVDEFLHVLCRYIMTKVGLEKDTGGSVTGYTFHSKGIELAFTEGTKALLNNLPSEYRSTVYAILGLTDDMTEDEKVSKALRTLFLIVEQCGDDNGTRAMLYFLLAFAKNKDLNDLVGTDEKGNPNGSNTLAGAAEGIKTLFLVEKDESGTLTKSYATYAEAADALLMRVLNRQVDAILNSGRFDQGSASYNDIVNFVETIAQNPARLRRIVLDLLAYEDGPFKAQTVIRNGATFAAYAQRIATAHYNETYAAWMLSKDSAYPPHGHQLQLTERQEPTCTQVGHVKYWTCTECGHLFADEAGTNQISPDDITLPATGHDWGPWEVTKPATETEEGMETRVCKHDPNHKETRAIPKKKATPKKDADNTEPAATDSPAKKGGDKDAGRSKTDSANAGKGHSSRPKTGDESKLALWNALAIVSGTLLIVTWRLGRREN